MPLPTEAYASLLKQLAAKSLPLVERITPATFIDPDTGTTYYYATFSLLGSPLPFYTPSHKRYQTAYRDAEKAIICQILQHPHFTPHVPVYADRHANPDPGAAATPLPV